MKIDRFAAHGMARMDRAGEGRLLFAQFCAELGEHGSAQIPGTLEQAEILAAHARRSNEVPAVLLAVEHALGAWLFGVRRGFAVPAKRVNNRIYRAARVSSCGAITLPGEFLGWAEEAG